MKKRKIKKSYTVRKRNTRGKLKREKERKTGIKGTYVDQERNNGAKLKEESKGRKEGRT